MRELLERLCALNAVSSWEDEVRALLLAEVEPHADRLRVDALGNLIAWKKGRKHTGSKLLLTAHMDEVGLMIRQITDDGYLKFDTVGAIDRRVLLGKPVLVGPKRVPGVVGLKAYHLVSREEEKSVPKLDEFYIDIGARDRAGAEAQVALGDTAAFDSDAGDFGAGLFHGKALGSRLGCAVLLTLLRDELPMDCTFVFTAQKEVGARGAFGAAFSVTPEVALVVDGADAADLAGVPAHKQGCSLGGGVVLPYMDQGAIADRGLFEALRSLAEAGGIPWQTMRSVAGRTDTAAIHTAHMDEVGLMIRQITDDGYLKFDTVGAIDRRVLLGKPVLVGPKRVPGVVGLKAYHLVSREEEKSVPKLDEFYIDIGARDRAGAEAQVALGDTAAFDSDAGDFGAGLFHGKALGSRLGCAVLLTLLRDELPMDCTFVFTAQKEVGARGAFGAAFSVTPEVALVVDGADAADLAGVPAHKQGCSLGGGVVLPYMDQGAIADRGLFEALRSLAEAGGIPWQTMRSVAGRTDTAAIQRTKEGVRTAAVSIPVRYPRTPSGVTCLRDAEAALALIRAFVGHLAEKE